MKLTSTQLETFRLVEMELQTRKPVLLTGDSNGKTTLLHQALEVLAQKDEKTGELVHTAKHSENSTIQFFPRVYFPKPGSETVPHLMRQILCAAKREPGHHTGAVVENFDNLMVEVANKGNMICLAIDNAELLGSNAWTILKVLNEYRDPYRKRNIGTGLLIAGGLLKLKKMPPAFLKRCTDHAVEKLTDKDVVALVEGLYPGQYRYLTGGAISSLKKAKTTLAIRGLVDELIAERVYYRLSQISEEDVEKKIAHKQHLEDMITSKATSRKAA